MKLNRVAGLGIQRSKSLLVSYRQLGVWLAVSTLVSWRSAELERLDAEIAQRGGKIELTDCGGRLCAYASTNQGEGYKDWKAPWSGRDDLPLVILRGY